MAVKQVDGRPVAHELIGFGAPFEDIGEQSGSGPDNGDSGEEGFEGISVGDMQLHSTAGFSGAFLKARFEIQGTEQHSGEVLGIE